MSSFGSDSEPSSLAADSGLPSDLGTTRVEGKPRIRWVRTLTMLGGILAGLASFGVGEAIYHIIPAKLVLQTGHFGMKVMGATQQTQMTADAENASLAFGALGLYLGGFLGIAGGLARRSTIAAITGGLLGVLLGAALGAGVSRAVLPAFLKVLDDYQVNDLLIPVLTHALIWGLVGASAGLAFAVGLGERRLVGQAVFAGVAGAVLGSIAFDMIGATFFTSAWTAQPISHTWPTRLMARLLVTIGTAVALALLIPTRDNVAKHQTHTI